VATTLAKPLRVLLADDHALVRAGIRALLNDLDGIEVVAEAGDGREALALLDEHQPDLLLLDVMMPELNGLEVAARTARDYPQVKVIVLSVHADEECVRQALQAGAAGYLVKNAGASELELAVRAVARGETYLSPAVSRHVVNGYIHRPHPAPGARHDLYGRSRGAAVAALARHGRLATLPEVLQGFRVTEVIGP
jgi:DNA-binding NarL/FixJ family response regulator